MSFEIDKEHDIPVYSFVCIYCKHLDQQIMDVPGCCEAFKDGIPIEIWMGDNRHLKPLPDQDNAIVFEKAKGD